MILNPVAERLSVVTEGERKAVWSYDEAFGRHEGLLTRTEQQCLRQSCVAIAGLGGVGGLHLETLVRLGIGGFHIADPDSFELANFNRQYGATAATVGRSKASVMADVARAINPEVQLGVFAEPLAPANVDDFLQGVQVLVDGIDFFALPARRLLFAEARRRGIWAVTAGPIGFSTSWLVFDPQGMSFDEYFDLHDGQENLEQLISFLVGLAPRATQRPYMQGVDLGQGRGPSASLACHLCSGVTAAEVLKILLQRGPLHAAPHYGQFDAYRRLFRTGFLRGGNRHPLQRLKRWWLRRRLGRIE